MSRILRLPENTAGRDFVVGDLHGCYDLLIEELVKVNFDTRTDRLISVGDLVDRGPNSFSCLKLPYEPWFYAVRGNHEELMQSGLNGGDVCLWMVNGGDWAMEQDSLRDVKVLVNDIMSRLPYAIEIPCAGNTIGIIHAEVPGGDWAALEASDTAMMTWGRTKIAKRDWSFISGIDAVISGHTIVNAPLLLGNQLFIDTGAYHTGKLTVLNLTAWVREMGVAA